MGQRPERESRPLPVPLPRDPDEVARIEARNALRQFDAVVKLIDDSLRSGEPFGLKPSIALELNRVATEGTNLYPGVFRPHPVLITGSKHKPPEARDVPALVEEMCDYVSKNWQSSPIHLSAYLMWRTNWIHPFSDGNGRTARALSYAILCIRLGYHLPGTKTIPEQIASNKGPYYDALEAADKAYGEGKIDTSALEELLAATLAVQLIEIHKKATGQ